MYNFLIIPRPALSADIDCLGLLAELMPSLDTIAMHQNISTPSLLPQSSQKNEASPGNIFPIYLGIWNRYYLKNHHWVNCVSLLLILITR